MPLINAVNPDPSHEKLFFSFLIAQKNQNITFWEKDKPYLFNNKLLRFSHNIVWRERKKGDDWRFEVFNDYQENFLGKGGYGTVYKTLATLVVDPQGLVSNYVKDKQRAIKIQTHESAKSIQSLDNEYAITSLPFKDEPFLKLPYRLKKPTLVEGRTSYLVMNLIEKTLYQVIKDHESGKKVLSEEDIIDLIYTLLVALKQQVTDRNIIHFDLKPQNIGIEGKYPIIMDYGFAETIDNVERCLSPKGTRGYKAPEIYREEVPTFKADVWSMGMVIFCLMGGNDDISDDFAYHQAHNYKSWGFLLKDLFSFRLTNEQISIYNIIDSMFQSNIDLRMTVDELIDTTKNAFYSKDSDDLEWSLDEESTSQSEDSVEQSSSTIRHTLSLREKMVLGDIQTCINLLEEKCEILQESYYIPEVELVKSFTHELEGKKAIFLNEFYYADMYEEKRKDFILASLASLDYTVHRLNLDQKCHLLPVFEEVKKIINCLKTFYLALPPSEKSSSDTFFKEENSVINAKDQLEILLNPAEEKPGIDFLD